MIQYRIIYSNPHRHFISFEAKFPTAGKQWIRLQLPSWRPGRYELGNFAKNIRLWHALDEFGNLLPFYKKNKDLWEVPCQGFSEITIRYEYYAAELNAGSTYLDEEQLYINPVNCFFYDADKQDQPYRLEFFLPERFEIACGMKRESEHTLLADNFDELADSPLIASASMRSLEYVVKNVNFHIWIQGSVDLDEERMVREFQAFTEVQMKIFKDIPCSEYHFMFQLVPYKLRHGVEHHNSTVIAMGPSVELLSDRGREDLLAISCHELFHTWNVKNIRPKEMMPYDFSKENYSHSGYVAEGVTTYYGDLLLWTSGLITDMEWFITLSEAINTHVANDGRFSLSVAESSFDTWLDGYTPGIPWRKVSIYNEGSLIAFICDVMILKATSGKASLDDAMKKMYEDFGKQKIGYTGDDYRQALEAVSGISFRKIFDDLIFGTKDYIPHIAEALNALGMKLSGYYPESYSLNELGLTLDEAGGKTLVKSVVESSPADTAHLWPGDEIIAVNRIVPQRNFDQLMEVLDGRAELTVVTKGKLRKLNIATDGSKYNLRYVVQPNAEATAEQKALFEKWKQR